MGQGRGAGVGMVTFWARLWKKEHVAENESRRLLVETSFDQELNQQTKQAYPFRHPIHLSV